jgi:hypothetical protein
MMGGLIHSRAIRLGTWAPFVVSRARYSQSTVRRFRRWLDNDKIEVHPLYSPLLPQALIGWGEKTRYVALDTSLVWHSYCMVRLAVMYRGRAVPLVWCVLEHGRAAVAYDVYKAFLEQVNTLVPFAWKVVLLVARGCTDTALLHHLQRLGGHFRLRIKATCGIYRPGHEGFQGRAISLAGGQARCWHGVLFPRKRCGPVPLAVARPLASDEYW